MGSIKKKADEPTVKAEEIEDVIFHIHGGGFVGMSSATHRNHTIRWAKTMGKIIFSVDYRLAPDNPYPAGIDDCW